jgi:RNA polymerase sigma-70 factor (ECF subfamily)
VTRDDATVFERTFLPLLADCAAFALALTGNRSDADDLVQDAYLKAQRAFASFSVGTNAKAWIFTILRRLHIDRFRRGRLRPVPVPEEEIADRIAAPAPPEADPILEVLPPGSVLAALEQVPEPFRLPVRLRDLDGLSYREIAEILAVPPGTVMSRIHRGRECLRGVLVSMLKARRERTR